MALVPTNNRKLSTFLRFILLAELVIAFVIASASYEVINSYLNSSLIVCPLRRFTGLLCAFCGMTHAWISIFQGKWRLASEQNWFSVPIFLFFNSYLMVGCFGLKFKLEPARQKILVLMALSTLIIYALFRNLMQI